MENTNYLLQQKIQTLVNGEANAEEVREMADLLNSEPTAKAELQFSESLARVLKNSEMVAAALVIRQVVQAEGFPPPPAPQSSFFKRYWRWGMAGSALLMVGSIWFFSSRISSSRAIARQLLQPMENVLFIPQNGNGLASLKAGMEDYDAGRFASAATQLETYINQTPDGSARIYLGIALLMDGKAEKAIPHLLASAQSPEPPIQEAAAWYLALAYIDTGNQRDAQQILSKIPADSQYAAEAAQLLQNL